MNLIHILKNNYLNYIYIKLINIKAIDTNVYYLLIL
jgi:hypothetical protein